ncbi:MAG: hypothetical protein KDE53_07030 [Caldilineaceae bacterium]|nr:hypothetical protein [Caldilineaceae bacterium]
MTNTTPAYIFTVRSDHTVVLPNDVPIGAKVAVVLVGPDDEKIVDKMRHARFQKVLDAIKAAVDSGYEPPAISDAEIDARIERARHAHRS